MEPLIKINNLTFGYDKKLLLHHLYFTCNQDDFIGITGENGSGKSTLLKLITGIIKSPKDTIIRQKNLKISYVDQVTLNNDSTFPATVKEILEMSIPHNFWGIVTFKRDEKIKKAVDYLNISDLLNKKMQELSGGQQQKVRLAKALLNQPNLLILDEPTTGLHQDDIKKLLKILERIVDNGDTVVIIEHNLDVIKVADYIIDLGPEGGSGGGTVVAVGTPEEVVNNPNSYTGQYLKQVL